MFHYEGADSLSKSVAYSKKVYLFRTNNVHVCESVAVHKSKEKTKFSNKNKVLVT